MVKNFAIKHPVFCFFPPHVCVNIHTYRGIPSYMLFCHSLALYLRQWIYIHSITFVSHMVLPLVYDAGRNHSCRWGDFWFCSSVNSSVMNMFGEDLCFLSTSILRLKVEAFLGQGPFFCWSWVISDLSPNTKLAQRLHRALLVSPGWTRRLCGVSCSPGWLLRERPWPWIGPLPRKAHLCF